MEEQNVLKFKNQDQIMMEPNPKMKFWAKKYRCSKISAGDAQKTEKIDATRPDDNF